MLMLEHTNVAEQEYGGSGVGTGVSFRPFQLAATSSSISIRSVSQPPTIFCGAPMSGSSAHPLVALIEGDALAAGGC